MNIDKFKYRVYGRTRSRGKKNITKENFLLKTEKYIIKKLDKKTKYILDIGSGYGESTIFLSTNNKKNIIISCETYINGNLNLVNKIENHGIKNIRIYPGNVNQFLDNLNQYIKLKKIYILFPDPWPKKKHIKRRLITNDFLKKLNIFLQPNGEIVIATDSLSYSKQIFKCIFNVKDLFNWNNQRNMYLDLNNFYNLETKYYNKAIISGRKPSIFILTKI